MINSGIPIRLATVEDAAGMASVLARAWKFAYADFLDPDFIRARSEEAEITQRFRENWNLATLKIVAVTEADEVVGFATERRPVSLPGYDAEIGGLYVDPGFSRGGVGRLLVEHMVTHFVGVGHVSLVIQALSQNQIGCRFYEKLGGREGSHGEWNGIPSKWYVWQTMNSILNGHNSGS